jgi:hypothetical protein
MSEKIDNNLLKAYASHSFQGIIRNYNEDKTKIISNFNYYVKNKFCPPCSYFAVFDGHGG